MTIICKRGGFRIHEAIGCGWVGLPLVKKGAKIEIEKRNKNMYVVRRVSWNRFLVNKLVYGIIILKFYVCGTITQILGNLRRIRTITHAI